MKFGKSLSNQIGEALPEWRDKFLSYKDLKKRLKLMRFGSRGSDAGATERSAKRHRIVDDQVAAAASAAEAEGEGAPVMTREEEEDFMSLLEAELEKFNAFFLEKEEEYIIRQKELQDRITAAISKDSMEELMKVRKEIVDFHGEMVLLENYSALNYTGLVKILKKYDKRTGALIRLPFIQKVLQQPFFTTDLLYKLVKECESMLDRLFPKNKQFISSKESGKENREDKPLVSGSSFVGGTVPELEEIEYMESLYMKSTLAALRALKEIRSGSSTVSVFSLPPLQNNGFDEKCNNIPVVEQAAK